MFWLVVVSLLQIWQCVREVKGRYKGYSDPAWLFIKTISADCVLTLDIPVI